MKATDLRIGNLVSPTEELKKEFWENVYEIMPDVIEVSQTAKDGIIHCIFDGEYDFDIKQLQSIKLTKQWLIDFGFVPYLRVAHKIRLNKFTELVLDLDRHCIVHIKEEYNSIEIGKIEYVHELQNLYYALSGGEELTLKK